MSALIPASELSGEDEEETKELQALARCAREFLSSFSWCRAVKRMHAGLAIGGVVGVFLCELEPNGPDVDNLLWVIVGDLPSAYLVTDDAPTSEEALQAYIELMDEWVEAVKQGKSVDDLIPVNAPATAAIATMLESRLRFLQERVLDRKTGEQ